jgi:hypothetical protein
MKQFNTLLFAACMAILAPSASGQFSFSNKTTLLTNPSSFTSGVAVAVADMNADGLDDIIRLNDGYLLSIEYQTPDDQAFSNFEYGDIFPGNEDAWAIVVGDVNNDGYCDVMAGGYYTGIKMLTAMSGGSGLNLSTLPDNDLFTQGSNMADINNDGWLDAFSCHDDGESRIWGNDGSGNFFMADEWIDMATTPLSDNSGNYGSVWSDFDNDGDLDLYIAKCRQGVNDPDDPRRINALFINDGLNNFTEAAEKHGLKIKWQSWTAEFQDIDNDGDMDCLVTNHDYPMQLLENDGAGFFTDITDQAGLAVAGLNYYNQGLMRDFDNDGFVDIVTAQPALFFHNNGDKTFTQITNPTSGSFGSMAIGDLNHDGFLDLYTAYQNGFNGPSNTPDKLWINDGNSNHFLAVNLRGVQSNRMGVGARIEIHGAWGIQVREVRAGESYGVSNSLCSHFGLGQETEVEYLVVRWPSGTIDVVKNPAADQFITIEEGSTCSLGTIEVTYDGPAVLCPGETVTLTAPAGYDYLWNNGAVSQSITLAHPGNLSLVAVDSQGCAGISEPLAIASGNDQQPVVTALGETKFCEGGSVELASSPALAYTWSNGETTPFIQANQSGDYFVTVQGQCSELVSEPLHIEVWPRAETPQADDVTIFGPGTATLTATGFLPHWYDSPDGLDILAIGNEFETPELSATTSYYVEDIIEYGGGDYSVGMTEHQGTLYSGSNDTNGQLIFDVFETVILEQVKVQTDFPGERTIELRSPNGAVLQSVDANIEAGTSYIDIGFEIEPGVDYVLTTNEAKNEASLNVAGPRLVRSNQGVVYPYTVQDLVSLKNSDFGTGYYYYFYDWKISAKPTVCTGDRATVTVFVEPNAVGEALPFGQVSVQPNPSNGHFNVTLEPKTSGPATLGIYDLRGRPVFQNHIELTASTRQNREIALANIPAGMYLLKITSGEQTLGLKLVIE